MVYPLVGGHPSKYWYKYYLNA